MAGNQMMRNSHSSLDLAGRSSMMADRSLDNKYRENWMRDNYNFDPSTSVPLREPYYNTRGEINKVRYSSMPIYNSYKFADRPQEPLIDNLEREKQAYQSLGGQDPPFLRQVRDLENQVVFNRVPATPWNTKPGMPAYYQTPLGETVYTNTSIPHQVAPPGTVHIGGNPFHYPPAIGYPFHPHTRVVGTALL